MKITPDYLGRNDGLDDDTFRYYEEVDDEMYFYEIYVRINNEKHAIIITGNGVSIDNCSTGQTTTTNIKPNKLFPNCDKLNWEQVSKIIQILENTGLEGKTYSKEEMDALYQEWKDKGCP